MRFFFLCQSVVCVQKSSVFSLLYLNPKSSTCLYNSPPSPFSYRHVTSIQRERGGKKTSIHVWRSFPLDPPSAPTHDFTTAAKKGKEEQETLMEPSPSNEFSSGVRPVGQVRCTRTKRPPPPPPFVYPKGRPPPLASAQKRKKGGALGRRRFSFPYPFSSIWASWKEEIQKVLLPSCLC